MSERKQTMTDRFETNLSSLPSLSKLVSSTRNSVTSFKKNKKHLVAKKKCHKLMSSMKKSLRLKSVENVTAKVGILPMKYIHHNFNGTNNKIPLTQLKNKIALGHIMPNISFQGDNKPSVWFRKKQKSISRTIVSSVCMSPAFVLCGSGNLIGAGIAYAAGATLSVAITEAMLSPSKNNRDSAQPTTKKRKHNHSYNQQEEQKTAFKRARSCNLSPTFKRKMTSKDIRD